MAIAGIYLHDGFDFSPRQQCPFFWTLEQWKQYVDFLSFCGIHRIEFCTQASFLRIPSTEFEHARISRMQAVIEYAHELGLACWLVVSSNVLSGVPDGQIPVGQQSSGAFYEPCPRDPDVRKKLLEVIDFFVSKYQAIDGYELFAGDWGGCTCGGCDIHTFFELATDYYQIIRSYNSNARVQINTWCINYWRKLPNKYEDWEEKFDMEANMAGQAIEWIEELPSGVGIALPFHHLYRPLAIQNRRPEQCPAWPDKDAIEKLQHVGRPVSAWPHFVMENDPYHKGRFGLFCCRVGYIKQLLTQLAARGITTVMGNLYHPYLQPLSGFAFGTLMREPELSVEEVLFRFAMLVAREEDVQTLYAVLCCLEHLDPWQSDLPAFYHVAHPESTLTCGEALSMLESVQPAVQQAPLLSSNQQILSSIADTLQKILKGTQTT